MSASPSFNSQGQFWYDFTNHRIRLYSVGNPATYYSNIECALRKDALMGMSSVNYVKFQNLDFRYWGTCVWEYGGNYLTFSDCDVSFIGGCDLNNNYQVRYGNGLQMWEGIHDITIERCHVDNCYDAGISPQGYADGYSAYNLFIHDNIISNCEYLFEFYERGATTSTHDIHFENNTCINAGGGWSHGQRGGDNGCCVRLYYYTAPKTNIFIRNNIFSNATQELFCLDIDADLTNVTLDNNLYYQSSGAPIATRSSAAGTFSTLAAWKTATGKETHGVAGNPLFASSTNFQLQSTSPAINAGVSVGLTTDYLGNAIVGLPDIGAFESGNTTDTNPPMSPPH
jgi:polygalacturonase